MLTLSIPQLSSPKPCSPKPEKLIFTVLEECIPDSFIRYLEVLKSFMPTDGKFPATLDVFPGLFCG